MLLAGACSVIVSSLMLASRRHALLGALLPSLAAFGVSLVVLACARAGIIDGPLRDTDLPHRRAAARRHAQHGVAELLWSARWSLVPRVFNGIVQLLLFALGASSPQGWCWASPMSELVNTRLDDLGWWSMPLGLLVILFGITFSEMLPFRMFGWTGLVLVCTFATQLAGRRGATRCRWCLRGAVVASASRRPRSRPRAPTSHA